MGCWNETCMISNLPIFSGEMCYNVILSATPAPSNSCYPTTLFSPIHMIKGRYNDYGGIEDLQERDDLMLVMAKCLKEKEFWLFAYKKDGKITEVNEIPRNTPEMLDLIHDLRPGLYIDKIPTFAGFHRFWSVFIRADILDPMLDAVQKDDDCGLIWPDYQLKHELLTMQPVSKGDIADRMMASEYAGEFCRILSMNNVGQLMFRSFIEEALGNDPGKSRFHRFERILHTSYILMKLRKTWAPQSGAGSQTGYDEMQALFGKLYDQQVTQMLADERREMDYDQDEQEDW